ncbi:MAG: DUF1080 domain-containing protein [Puniceicoccaceae bacterium]
MHFSMHNFTRLQLLITVAVATTTLIAFSQPDPDYLIHDRTRPLPPVVQPGTVSTTDTVGTAPSDAIVLFDGSDLLKWAAADGRATEWIIRDGVLECKPGAGTIRTRRSFGDCQLHVEWASPKKSTGAGQGDGNSGVFFGNGRYEIQVLQSHGNPTYADGSAGSIYGQYPPLVNVTRPAGEWQVYDIIYTAPRFKKNGKLKSKARVTVLHNGVLIQNNVELTGPNNWFERPPYSAHPVKMPITFQDHGNPVRFRNIWVRELDDGKPEYFLPDATLDSYAGDYKRGNETVEVRRLPDGLLSISFADATLKMHATSSTEFFNKETDVQCEFRFSGGEKNLAISVGQGEMICPKID